jgi:hypothetical protein
MTTTVNQTFNAAAGAELISLGEFVRNAEAEIAKAWGFFVFDNKNWVVKVEVMNTLDAFAPTIDG